MISINLLKKYNNSYKKIIILVAVVTLLISIILFISLHFTNKSEQLQLNNFKIKEKTNLMNYAFSNLDKDLNSVIDSHAYWTDLQVKLSEKNTPWVRENAGAYIIDTDFANIDHILISNEDTSYIDSYGELQEEDLLSTIGFSKTLEENKSFSNIIKVDNNYYYYKSVPITNNNYNNHTGAYIVFSNISKYMSTFINKEINNDIENIEISKNKISILNNSTSIISNKILDTNYYLNYKIDFSETNNVLNNSSYTSYFVIFLLILITVGLLTLLFQSMNKRLNKVILQLNKVDDEHLDIKLEHEPTLVFSSFNMLITHINNLLKNIRSKIDIIDSSYLSIIGMINKAVEMKDTYTSEHNEAVSLYSQVIAQKLDGFDDYENLEIASKFHDIGKLFTPVQILNKTTRLTDEEFDIIKHHPLDGYKILSSVYYFRGALDGIKFHHERWNGSGYPNGLLKDEIPLMAQIIAIADVYDAVTSSRAYRDAMSHEEAVEIIVSGSGKDFSPLLVDIFKDNKSEFKNILMEFNRKNYYKIYKDQIN